MFSRKRKFNEIEDDSDELPLADIKRRRTNIYPSSTFTGRMTVKKTFARNRKKRNNTSPIKHLHRKQRQKTYSSSSSSSSSEESEDDEDYIPKKNKKSAKGMSERFRLKYKKLKLSPTKTSKKIQSTLDLPIIKKSKNNINKCGPIQCKDCAMLYYPGRNEDDTMHKRFHKS